jgi:hypothetical protein
VTTPEDLALVELGNLDIDPSVLTGDGTTLEDALGEHGSLTQLGDRAAELPTDGWRLIGESNTEFTTSQTFAAPHPAQRDAWAVLHIAKTRSGWLTSADPRPTIPLPGWPARRKGLRLDWPAEPFTGSPTALPELTITTAIPPAGPGKTSVATAHTFRPGCWIRRGSDCRPHRGYCTARFRAYPTWPRVKAYLCR